jgi:hypothetical protein
VTHDFVGFAVDLTLADGGAGVVAYGGQQVDPAAVAASGAGQAFAVDGDSAAEFGSGGEGVVEAL